MKLKFNNLYQIVVWAAFVLFSMFSVLLCLLDNDKPSDYALLFLLPLCFLLCSIIFSKVFTYMFDNIGITLIVLLMFVRNVLSPMLMSMYGYETSVVSSGTGHMGDAILLTSYEMLCVFATIMLTLNKTQSYSLEKVKIEQYSKRKYTDRGYRWLVILAVIVLIGCIVIEPQLLEGYRFITEMGEEGFANYEDTQLVNKYGTTTLLKFVLVTGNYLMRALLAIVPGFLIVKLSERKTRTRRILSLCCCCIPLFFIGGVIARSLIYMVCLLLLYIYLYTPKEVPRKMAYLFLFASAAVVGWWMFRSVDSYGMQNFSAQLNAYFSGINNVCASLNLEGTFFDRFGYLVADITNSIPYGGTVFNNSHQTMSDYFNSASGVRGQIPTTIGTGMYYFGPIFAPLFSCIFAHFSVDAGARIKGSVNTNPMRLIRLLLTAMYLAMGIIMYNISITLTNFFSILLPMYLMERAAYKKE